MNVIAVSRRSRRIVLEDGSECAITSFHDFEGDETTDAEAAIAAVAQLPSGQWVTVDLRFFEMPKRH